MSDDRRYTVGSGNVFADLGFDDPEEEIAKSDLTRHIGRIVRERRWTQAQAARAMGIDQPKVSALVRGRFEGFTMDRLLRFRNALDHDVQITVTPKPESRSRERTTRRARVSGAEPGAISTRALSLTNCTVYGTAPADV